MAAVIEFCANKAKQGRFRSFYGKTVEKAKESSRGEIPVYHKLTLTIKEAAEYSNIGINKNELLLKQPNCPFVLYVGTRKLVKRQEFEEFIREELVI